MVVTPSPPPASETIFFGFSGYVTALIMTFGILIWLDSIGVPGMRLVAVMVGLGVLLALAQRNMLTAT